MKLFGRKKQEEASPAVLAPCSGKLLAIEDVGDGMFSEKLLGDGVAIEPENGQFHAPISGTLTSVFPTGHAYGIQSPEGREVLVHIGLDTVELEGRGFTICKKQGEKVKAGDLVIKADLKDIASQGYPTTTMLVQTDKKHSQKKLGTPGTNITANTPVLELN